MEYDNNWFIEKSSLIHGDKYDYSLVDYRNSKTKVKIICPIHGEFEQMPDKHLKKRGCPHCGGTTKLTIGNFINNCCVEFDGLQHFEPILYFGGEKEFIKRKNNDKIKQIFV